MQQIRRIQAAFLLAAALICAGLPGAQAAVINPDEPGFIAIYKYASDEGAEAGAPATGLEQSNIGLEPIPRIAFTVTRVADDTEDVNNAEAVTGEDAYSHTELTNAQGLAMFDMLAHGVYLVQEAPNAAVTEPVEDFLVQIPMTNPSGDGFLYGVYVYPKNTLVGKPGVRMYIGEPGSQYGSAVRGEEVSWHILSGIPGDIAQAEAYIVQATLDKSLVFSEGSALVYTQDSISALSALEEEAYTLSQEGDALTVSLTGEGRQALAEALEEDKQAELYITFRTALQAADDAFPEILGTPLYAEATLRYTSGLGIETLSELAEGTAPYVYLGGLVIQKTDGRTGEPLRGAAFRIYPTRQDASNDTNALTAPGGGVWEVTTDEYGFAAFYGLPYGEGATAQTGTSIYYLVETQAPEGYNLIGSPIDVTVSHESHVAGQETQIENYTGFTLPLTGGAGTMIFIIAGLLLVAAAVFMLARAKRNAR